MRFSLSLALLCLSGICFARLSPQKAPIFDMDIRVDPAQRSLKVKGSMVLLPAKREYSQLTMLLADQMMLESLSVDSVAAKVAKAGSRNGKTGWTISLPSRLAKGQQAKLEFAYSGGSTTTFVFHIGPEGSFAGGPNTAWYPQVGEITIANGRIGFDGSTQGSGRLVFHAPKEITVVASGARKSETMEGDEKVTEFLADKPCALSFAMAKYSVFRSPGKVPVALYLFEPRADSQEFVKGCRDVVDVLSRIFGGFPYAEFAVVEVADEAANKAGFGGAGLPGFMLSNTSFLKGGFNLAFFGHEIGHQWWGNYVTHEGSSGEYMMDEALAQYGSLRCVEFLRGPTWAERYRKTGYPGYVLRQNGYSYLNFAAAGLDNALDKLPGELLSHELADMKGFLVYDMLRREIGEQAFHGALQQIVREHGLGSITWDEFKATVERAAHRDLGWFWEQWMTRKGAPNLTLTSTISPGAVAGRITQKGMPYRLRMPVQIVYGNGRAEVKQVDISGSSTDFRFATKGAVKEVLLDPCFEVLHYQPGLEAEALASIGITRAGWLFGQRKNKEAEEAYRKIADGPDKPDPYGVRYSAHYTLGQVYRSAGRLEEAREELEMAIAYPTRKASTLAHCYLTLARTAQAQKDFVRAAWAAEAAIAWEINQRQRTDVSKDAEELLKNLPKT